MFGCLIFTTQINANNSKFISFKIAPGELKSVLLQFSNQADISFAINSNLIKNVQCNRFSGKYTIKAALNQLLKNTSLKANFNQQGIFVLTPNLTNTTISRRSSICYPIKQNKPESKQLNKSPIYKLKNTKLTFKNEAIDDMELIEIIGFKGSLLKSLLNKRYSQSISDSIFSEDIGKSSDQDIGEALQRITGVSIQRGGGASFNSNEEGTTISVRGAGPNLNNVILNGITLTGNTENQAVDLSAFSSDILHSIEVIKTSSADHDEGSLGANVMLKTLRPLQISKEKNIFEAQYRYDNFAQQNDYKLSGAISRKFLNENLGVFFSFFTETQAQRKDMFFTSGIEAYTTPYAINFDTREVMENVTGYQYTQTGYKLFLNDNKRKGFNSTIQWMPSKNTEVILNTTFSHQDVIVDDNTMLINGTTDPIRADDPALELNNPWIVYNPNNQMFVKKLNRILRGRTSRLQTGINTTNKILSLEMNHSFSDNFQASARMGSSITKAKDDYYTFLNSNNYVNVSVNLLASIPPELIEPTGYDCSSGKCYIITGTSNVDFGPDQNGAVGEDNSDNIAYTSYNPDDLSTIHLQQAVSRNRKIKDEQHSIYLDFDWDISSDFIHSIEFGGKYQYRKKGVVNEEFLFGGTPQPQGIEPLGIDIETIRLEQVTDGKTPFGNDFLADLGYDRTNTTDGWYTINARKSFELIFGNENVHKESNLTKDRDIALTNSAFYIKTNFSLLEGDLTGNLGVRYVGSKVESNGYSGIDFQNVNITDRQLIKIATDSSLPACTSEQLAQPAGAIINGIWGPSPGQYCYHMFYNVNPGTRNRYLDNRRPEDPGFIPGSAINKTHNLLPSLNLNYQLTDKMITRLAISKTMARPRIDSLKPNYTYREDVWSGESNGTVNNPYLKALESTNVDLAWEWYFNDTSAISVTLFHKNMKNFEISETVQTYWLDLRSFNDDEIAQLDPINDIIIPLDPENPLSPDTSNCMPTNRHRWESIELSLSDECDRIDIVRIQNGKGGKNQGLELTYNQNFDFLPGIFGGLGTIANYTYSDSKTDDQIGTLNTQIKPLPLANVSKHTVNWSVFWEKEGNLIRLAYNYRTDSLVNPSFGSGVLWNEGRSVLDLSASYKINNLTTLTFNAVNLTNELFRQYYTNLTDSRFEIEGNALNGQADKSRTIRLWNTGTIYRLGIRIAF